MKRIILPLLIIVTTTILLPGCSLITGEDTCEHSDIPIDTEFGHMLGYVPYSFLEKHDIWFGSFNQAKSLYGITDIPPIQELLDLPDDEKGIIVQALEEGGISGLSFMHYLEPIASLTGFDTMAFDRFLYGDVIPPAGFLIAEGLFDEELIAGKLVELGYTKTEYGPHSYYGIRDDYEMDLRHPLGHLVLASMNQIAIFDDTLITSPATGDITRVFATLEGNTPAAIENEICQALADSLGDVLMATLTTPERIVYSDLTGAEKTPALFDFTIPDNWGTLQGYELAALGYRGEGKERYIDIALYYTDTVTATADGNLLAERMQSYKLYCWVEHQSDIPFTERYQPGKPEVIEYSGGAVLKIACRLVLEEQLGASMLLGGNGMTLRDLLFLAPDPSPYIGKN